MKRILTSFPTLLFLLFSCSAVAQDTLGITEIRLTSSLVKQSLLRTPAAAAIIDSIQLKLQSTTSLVAAFNAVPGVRMEERSPGSYRLSLRGSLLRSPFGVRNVKVYIDDYPLTDAGGNTYINVVAMRSMGRIEILKGPDGSLFGANSGGVVNLQTSGQKENLSAEVVGGSYGLFGQNIALSKKKGRHSFGLFEGYQRSGGYRDNSQLHRFNIQLHENWQYNNSNHLKFFIFYTDLFYQTPGGLTQKQYDSFPSQARPPTATQPGAVDQKAAVYNKMLFGGITHTASLNKYIDHSLAIFGSGVNFKNPFITNYETREENTYGLRTFFTFSNNHAKNNKQWHYTIGIEWQQTKSGISNYINAQGNKGGLIASGDILTDQHFLFNRVKVDLNKKILVEAGLSLNYYSYRFKDSISFRNKFEPQWMPRIAINYSPAKQITLRTSVGRGYSPPTTAELRPSDVIYQNLQPETGTNIELGIRYFSRSNRFWIDMAAYHYRLEKAIVPQQDSLGNNYFINAGSTNQNGLESQVSWLMVSPDQHKKPFKKILLSNNCSFNNFRFDDYITGSANYSGNHITGVPDHTIVSNLLIEFTNNIYFFIQHNHTSNIPLNDANTFYSDDYDLLQLKTGYRFKAGSLQMELYAGIDNLLNEQYSLGNDLNAAGNRYFNAAALRNGFFGILLSAHAK